MNKNSLETPFKVLTLNRYPIRTNDLLQAWDAADELALEYLSHESLEDKKILVMNDSFGALACALEKFQPESYTDSFVSARGAELNSQGKIRPFSKLDELSGPYDYVIIKLPHMLSFFEDQLCLLTAHLHQDSKIICAGMVKYMTKNYFELLQKYLGKTTTSLAQKKARLIFCSFEKSIVQSPFPIQVPIEEFARPFENHSSLFSREKLDIGTRFLLAHLPQGNYKTILDLGCANGIVGIKAKQMNPDSTIIFCDDSQMAIQSAGTNYGRYFKDDAQYFWTNCFENQPANTLDCVICNPPFHQKTTVGDATAWQMFQDAHKALKPGGLLRVIGNTPLLYPQKLKRIFGRSQIIASNSKFTIVDAIK